MGSFRMADDTIPYWVLISILVSSVPLREPLALALHRTAYDLYRRDEATARLEGELAQGEVRNLRKTVLLGTLSGPAFEADVDTERGSGMVRFLLTQEGIELMSQRPASAMN
jgi:hypothetical protein